jgi:DNA-binding NarL/FixJ family response regulator
MTRNAEELRILVGDDHELMRRGIRALLHAQRGWTVVGEAANGKEAVEKVRKLTPSLAILDIEMPELDGLETTRRIREEAPNTQILILTMHGSGQMVRRVLEAGAHGYVTKSALPRHLVRAVKDVARGKPFLAPSVSEVVLKEFLKAGKKNLREPRSLRPAQPHASSKSFDS